MNGLKSLGAAVLATVVIGLSGCGDSGGLGGIGAADKSITIATTKAPEREIPENIRKIAVAQFTCDNARDAQYGDIASDKLVGHLDEANRKFNRYTLVDRQNLKKIMDERDLQLAISDSGSAIKAGQIAKVDGMIFGSVKVRAESVPATKTSFRTGGKHGIEPYQEKYVKHLMTVNLNLSLVDVQTGKSIVSKPFTQTYDSDKDKGDTSLMKLLNFEGSADRKSEMEAGNILIDRCVKQFVSMISPVEVSTKYKLARGKSKLVTQGNDMAAAGDLDGAMDAYKEALSAAPEDDAACYNAGLICEAKRDCKGADEYYTKAINIKSETSYIQARARVRVASNAPAEK